jgi:hypothetical protein
LKRKIKAGEKKARIESIYIDAQKATFVVPEWNERFGFLCSIPLRQRDGKIVFRFKSGVDIIA